MRSLHKAKKGDIPITLLVIEVLALCLLATFSFYISDRASKNTFNMADVVEKIGLQKEKMSVYKELGMNQDEIDRIFGVKEDVQGKYLQFEQENILVRYNLP